MREADLLELTVEEPVDAIVSTATFHWIGDHDRLFARLKDALKPGGRLVAQCGGEGNVAAVKQAGFELARARAVRRAPGRLAGRLELPVARGHRGAADARSATRTCGPGRRAWRSTSTTSPATSARSASARSSSACPEALHEPFVDAAVELLGAPLTIDYVRLNILARAPVS